MFFRQLCYTHIVPRRLVVNMVKVCPARICFQGQPSALKVTPGTGLQWLYLQFCCSGSTLYLQGFYSVPYADCGSRAVVKMSFPMIIKISFKIFLQECFTFSLWLRIKQNVELPDPHIIEWRASGSVLIRMVSLRFRMNGDNNAQPLSFFIFYFIFRQNGSPNTFVAINLVHNTVCGLSDV